METIIVIIAIYYYCSTGYCFGRAFSANRDTINNIGVIEIVFIILLGWIIFPMLLGIKEEQL